MAWRSHGRDNADLIAQLQANGIIKTDCVARAMRQVDRADYVKRGRAYEDAPQSISYNVTISAPHMHAYALESLCEHCIKPSAKILDVGSGSGYLTACLALLGETNDSTVVGIEHIGQLVDESRANVRRAHGALLDSKRVILVTGDGRLGFPDMAPYDAIHVGAASEREPEELIGQLAPGGRLFVPVGTHDQSIIVYDRAPNEPFAVTRTPIMGVRYVPLTDRDSQINRRGL